MQNKMLTHLSPEITKVLKIFIDLILHNVKNDKLPIYFSFRLYISSSSQGSLTICNVAKSSLTNIDMQ